MAKSKEELIYDIENELVDPTTNKITGERVKARLLDMVETMSESSGGRYKYYSIDEGSGATEFACELGSVMKFHPIDEPSKIFILSPVQLPANNVKIIAAAIDMSLRIMLEGTMATYEQYIEEALAVMGVESLDELGAHEINEDQFYAI